MASFEGFHVPQFAGEDFGNWAFRIKSILRQAKVLKAIEEKDYSARLENVPGEAKAQALLIAGVSDSHLDFLKPHKTAYDMFKNLEANFNSKDPRSRFYLRRLLSKTKYDGVSPLAEHIMKMEGYFSHLKEANSEVSEDDKIIYLMSSMPWSYDEVVTALESQRELKWDQVKNDLLREEERKKTFERKIEPTKTEDKIEASNAYNINSPGNEEIRGEKNTIIFTYCNDSGFKKAGGSHEKDTLLKSYSQSLDDNQELKIKEAVNEMSKDILDTIMTRLDSIEARLNKIEIMKPSKVFFNSAD